MKQHDCEHGSAYLCFGWWIWDEKKDEKSNNQSQVFIPVRIKSRTHTQMSHGSIAFIHSYCSPIFTDRTRRFLLSYDTFISSFFEDR